MSRFCRFYCLQLDFDPQIDKSCGNFHMMQVIIKIDIYHFTNKTGWKRTKRYLYFFFNAKKKRLTPASRLILTVICCTLCSFSCLAQKDSKASKDFDRGYYYWHYDKFDSAFLMLNRYVSHADDSLKKGAALKLIGDMLWRIDDYYGAQESLTRALHTLDPLNAAHHEDLGVVYNILGNASLDLKQYKEAVDFYNNALKFVKGSGYIHEVMNGKGIALQRTGRYSEAIALYDAMLALQPTNKSAVARIIDNRAYTKWLQDPAHTSLPGFWHALQMRTDSQYNDGLNASYAHLSDYYEKSNPDSARWYANKMRQQATQNQSPEDVLEAIDKLMGLTTATDVKQLLFERFKTLGDSLRYSRDTTRNRFALIRYDVQKSKADNLVLQQHITRQQLYVYGLMLLAAAILAGGYAWFAKRRKRMKEEAANAIRNARLKTSQKVHDVVANGLYGIMNELEHRNTVEPDKLIARIEKLYEKSRNISYEDVAPAEQAGYDREVHDLLSAFANDTTKVLIVGNQPTFWNNLTGHQKTQLHITLNELMVNMKKHSRAKNVVIQFRQENNTALIRYKDDGIGLPHAVQFGNGLRNTVNRINSLSGAVNFEKSNKAGVSLAISFPLQSTNS